MTTPDPAMTPDPRAVEIVGAAIGAHFDLSADASTGAWRYICDCGEVLPVDDMNEANELHEEHQGASVLAALAAAGWSLLPPGGQSGGKELRDALRRLGHGLIAVSPLLEKPYSDAPEWTPWSRFVHPRLLEVRRLAGIDQPSDTPGEPA